MWGRLLSCGRLLIGLPGIEANSKVVKMRVTAWGFIAALALSTQSAGGTDLMLRGKVVMEDGSPPGRAVAIERWCDSHTGAVETVTNRKGEFTMARLRGVV